ncbi:MAG: 30S ribosomal protein S27ae [Hadesarchaea archaeon]|nr:30S ribosomal protein S27ae [Hadesarchaea archaeon]
MEEEPEEEPEEVEEVEKKTEKKTKRERVRSKRYELYESDEDSVERLKKSCPRCGPGVFMADHGDRLACGKCGYTEFK